MENKLDQFGKTEERKEAKFNAALAKLERIHELRIGCHTSRAAHNWSRSFDILLSIRTEINDRMNTEEQTKANMFELMVEKAMAGKRIGVYHTRVVYGPYRRILYQYELFLCALIERFGMGMPNKPGVTDSISEME